MLRKVGYKHWHTFYTPNHLHETGDDNKIHFQMPRDTQADFAQVQCFYSLKAKLKQNIALLLV